MLVIMLFVYIYYTSIGARCAVAAASYIIRSVEGHHRRFNNKLRLSVCFFIIIIMTIDIHIFFYKYNNMYNIL